jgi:L-lactate dehydrogenase
LVDKDQKHLEGHLHDLRDAALFSHTTRVVAGSFSDCCDADVVIITAGVSQAATMRSRLENLAEGASILRSIVLEIACHDPHGVLLLASNPVDVLTYAAWKWSGLPAGRVIGSGTLLDTSRFRRRVAERFGVAPENVDAYIIGEHGDSQVPVLSSARIAGIPLDDFCRQLGLPRQENALKDIAEETRKAGLDIIRAKGATYYGIAAALVRIVAAILRDEHAALTVSSLAPPFMGFGEVCLSLPAVINRGGASRVLSIPLDQQEQAALRASADVLKRHLAMVENSKKTV